MLQYFQRRGIFKSIYPTNWAVLMIRKWLLTLSWKFPPRNYHPLLLSSFVYLSPTVMPVHLGISSTIWERLLCDCFRPYSFLLNITSSLTLSTYTMVLEPSFAPKLTLLWLTLQFVSISYRIKFPQFRTILSRGLSEGIMGSHLCSALGSIYIILLKHIDLNKP